MNRRQFLKMGLEGIVIGSIPLIYNCEKNPVKSDKSEPNYLNRYSVVKDNIVYSMQTDKCVYELGENVKMLYSITNKRSEYITVKLVTLSFIKPCTFIIGKDGSEVYNNNPNEWISNEFIPRVDNSFTLRLNENKQFYHNWDSKDKDGKLLDPGVYYVTGYLSFYTENDSYCPVSVPLEFKALIHPH